MDESVQRNLRESLKGKRVLDVGGGLGFLGKQLDPSTEYWVIDEAFVPEEKRLCAGEWLVADIEHDKFSEYVLFHARVVSNDPVRTEYSGRFDAAFCLGVSRFANPDHCIAEIKKVVKEGGDIITSLQDERGLTINR